MNVRRARQRLNQAFSLVEITMAIGILSFAMIAIMGLIPVTLKVSRDSIEKNLVLHMSQVVRADLSSQPFSTLAGSGTRYFDPEGEVLPDAVGARYRADYQLTASTPLPDAQTAGKLTVARIEIRNLLTGEKLVGSIHLSDNGL